jgi:surface antigen
MRPRSLDCLSAAFAVCILLPAAAQAQVIPFAGNFGQGLAPSDNKMIFESAARLNAVEPSKVGQSDSWSNPETKSSGTSTILRMFRSGGMACHLVRHHIVAGSRQGNGLHAQTLAGLHPFPR